MSVTVIWNGSAGQSGRCGEIREQLQLRLGDSTAFSDTSSPEDALRTVQQLPPDCTAVVAAGGDGTIHSTINALMQVDDPPPLGICPLGTGNTLCRTLGMPLDPLLAIDAIVGGATKRIDLAVAEHGGRQTYFANLASIGNSERVIRNLSDEDKQSWGPWAYLKSSLPLANSLTGFDMQISFDGGHAQVYRLWNVLVANGPFGAGGFEIVPEARLDDGQLHVVMIRDGTQLDLARMTAEFFLGNYLDDERVTHRRVQAVRIETTPNTNLLADGELLEGQPFEFHIHPAALSVIVPGDSSS